MSQAQRDLDRKQQEECSRQATVAEIRSACDAELHSKLSDLQASCDAAKQDAIMQLQESHDAAMKKAIAEIQEDHAELLAQQVALTKEEASAEWEATMNDKLEKEKSILKEEYKSQLLALREEAMTKLQEVGID